MSGGRRLDPIGEAAIDWMMRLDSGSAGATERQAFEIWLAQDPRHRHAWEHLQGQLAEPLARLVQAERQMPGQLHAATQALRQPGLSASRRKLLGGSGALLVLLGLSGGIALQRNMPLNAVFADLRSGTGERRRISLPDGSLLILNARSAVDLDFSADLRLLHLREGELQVSVAADASRPFLVQTAQGRVRALGTRFTVRQTGSHSLVSVQEHSVEISTLGGQHAVVESGGTLRFSSTTVSPQATDPSRYASWVDGLLEVRDEPLEAVIDALRPYRRGLLRVSPEAARLRVFGVFPLDDSERALQALAEVLPIRMERYGPWLTLIDSR